MNKLLKQTLLATAVTAAMVSTASAKELVVVSWGGAYTASAMVLTVSAEAAIDFEKHVANAGKIHKQNQSAKQKEKMRDNRHDNRLKMNGNTSIGASTNGVNVKITY
jgi:spermidine/putrescine-binding protein